MAKTKYYRVFKECEWTREGIAKKHTMGIWCILKGESPFFIDVTEISTDKEELQEAAREERERIRWSQSYSRNPRKMVYKVFIHEVDENGNYIPTKKEKETAIAWAKAQAMENADFAMANAEVLASL